MKTLVAVLLSIVLACASAPAITPDKPQPNQCFEGPFSIYRIDSEKWELLIADPPLFILKNPKIGATPPVVLVLLAPTGQVVRYCYMDGQNIRSFAYCPEKDCYVEETLTPELAAEGKKLLLKLAKETHCTI